MMPASTPFCQIGGVLGLEDAQGHGNGEHNGGTQHTAHDDAAEQGGVPVFRQLHGQRRTAHITGQQGTGKHGRVRAEDPEHGTQHRPQQIGQHRGQRDNTDHGQSQGAHGQNAFFKLGPQAEPVAENPVQRASTMKITMR